MRRLARPASATGHPGVHGGPSATIGRDASAVRRPFRFPPAARTQTRMVETATELAIRPVQELDIEDIAGIDEKIGGRYRPDVWDKRVFYYLRRDPEGSFVA